MSDDPQKTTRRRRSRRPSKRSGRSSDKVETTSRQSQPEQSAQPRRRRTPRSRDSEGETSRSPQLVVQKEDRGSLEVSRLNREIFIYTYTLYPRSYLDSYQAGPGIAERMDFEE